MIYHLNLKRVMTGKLILAIADGSLFVDGRLVYNAKNLKVGLFQPSPEAA